MQKDFDVDSLYKAIRDFKYENKDGKLTKRTFGETEIDLYWDATGRWWINEMFDQIERG